MQKRVSLFSIIAFCLLLPGKNLFAVDQIQSVRICALRVEFVADTNPLTTGDGTFMVDSVTTDPYAIDPAPHNKLYFEDQIRAAANYFKQVSAGRLGISGDVYPQAENGAFQLPHSMDYYNPNTNEQEINLGLSNLFVDAVTAADQSGEAINFADYDLVVVFHAGVGKDIDLGFDTTPQDISSLYVTSKFLKESLGSDFEGVAVSGSALRINSGIILPETENQDGQKVALTGMFVSNIGSHLGLYDLFSPGTQRSAVGRFDVMDVGLLNANGLIPSPPGAFSRKLLGWTNLRTVTFPVHNIAVTRRDMAGASAADIVQIPINEQEYFLLEFRGDAAVNIDSIYSDLLQDEADDVSYLKVLKKFFADQIEIGQSGVLISVPNYDWGLPGSGILIWHVDERIIAERAGDNRINDDPAHRAVDIEEADGSQDIGQLYGLLDPGYQTELGWLADFWFSNRPAYLKDFELYRNEFSTVSTPNSRANLDNAVSHITLKNFSDNLSPQMTFDFERDFFEQNFPVHIGTDARNLQYTIAGRPGGHSADFLFCLSGNGELYAIGAGGKGLPGRDTLHIASLAAAEDQVSLGLADVDADGTSEYLIAVLDDSLYGFELKADNVDPLFEPLGLGGKASGPVVCGTSAAYVPLEGNRYAEIDYAGNVISTPAGSGVALRDIVLVDGRVQRQFSENTKFAAVAFNSLGQQTTIEYEDNNKSFKITENKDGHDESHIVITEVVPTGQFALADLDGNGTYDILFNQADGVYAYNLTGSPIAGFPLQPPLSPDEKLIATPLLADADGDQQPDIITATSAGQVLGLKLNGSPLEGFPLSAGSGMESGPVILQLDEDEGLELMAATTAGSVYAWQLKAGPEQGGLKWAQANYGSDNNVYLSEKLNYLARGRELLPEEYAYNYPNPNEENHTTIRYYLNEDASVKIRLFDTAGFLVDEFNGPGKGRTDNEIRWDVTDVASGVYLCQIEAKSASGMQRRIIKIMVVH